MTAFEAIGFSLGLFWAWLLAMGAAVATFFGRLLQAALGLLLGLAEIFVVILVAIIYLALLSMAGNFILDLFLR